MDLLWHDDSGPPPGDPDAPVLVLLHAFPLWSVMWHRVLPLLTASVRVVRVDLPGLGRSGDAATGEPSVEAMAAGVWRVLDHLDVRTAAVHGVSTGGYVALAMARQAPDRTAALLLSSTTPWTGAPDVPAERQETADDLLRTRSLEPVSDSVTGGLGATARSAQPGLVVLLSGVIGSADPVGVAWAARAVAAREDTSAVLAAYAGPVLLLFGEEDTEVPEGTVVDMAGLRPAGATTYVEVLPGAGHLLALEQPRAVADRLLGVLHQP